MGYTYKEGWWQTKDYKWIKIKDMETSHIENSIKLLKRNSKFYDVEFINKWEVENFHYYEHNSDLVDKKIDELEFELRLRKLEKGE
jgi:hypothetical protein